MINIKVAEVMGRKKLTKKAVADITGIRPNTISMYWYGDTKRIDVEHLDKLCSLFSCQPGELLEYIPDPPEDVPEIPR